MQIDSGDLISEIEQHFRVSAGPGAGKTHWLVQHIKNVLHNSTRIGKTRKIACITYTNIAVETILERLGTTSEHVEVSTIHSFLYKHVVKPYAGFIAEEYGLNVARMDGHDDYVIHMKKLIAWVENHPDKTLFRHPFTERQLTRLPNNKEALGNWLGSLSYCLDANKEIQIKCDNKKAYYIQDGARGGGLSISCLNKLNNDFLGFKSLYWQKGILHHDDVLFFSYQIINKFPFVLEVLRAKFPYFFVDEFQDSNPIQVSILEKIGQEETIVGIIGDISQSIYGFQGANPSQLFSFSLNGIVDYEMLNNRRSTNRIIDVLNYVRQDMVQVKFRNIDGIRPIVFVGDRIVTFKKAKSLCRDAKIYSLSRNNVTSNAMKKDIGGVALNSHLLEELYSVDTNSERRRIVIACIKSVELAKEKKFKNAIKEFAKCSVDKKEALAYISILLSNYDAYKDGTLFDLYSFIRTEIAPTTSKVTRGAIKIFCDEHTYQQMAICVTITEDISLHKTIHKSKGDEFDNVMLVLKDESDLGFLLKPDLINNEEHRVNYVAVSRAKERLFMSVPALSDVNKAIIGVVFDVQEV